MTNKIILTRKPSTFSGTFGSLDFGSCDLPTLEPIKPIIPPGTYTIKNTWSPKFNGMRPLICGVKGHYGVRIHEGNTQFDTIGCVLIGLSREYNHLVSSRAALKKFYKLVQFPCTLIVNP